MSKLFINKNTGKTAKPPKINPSSIWDSKKSVIGRKSKLRALIHEHEKSQASIFNYSGISHAGIKLIHVSNIRNMSNPPHEQLNPLCEWEIF